MISVNGCGKRGLAPQYDPPGPTPVKYVSLSLTWI